MRTFWLLLSFLFTGCYDSSFDERGADTSSWKVTTTLAELQSLFQGEQVTIERDWVVEGVVTANDRGGNFYRSIVIEEAGAAAEIKLAIDALHNDYPIGARLRVALEGLAVGRSYGVLQIGLRSSEGAHYAVDYIGSKAAVDRCIQRISEAIEPIDPQTFTIDQLNPFMAGRLIRIEGVIHAPETPVEPIWKGYCRFMDAGGRTVESYVRSYADFAEEQLPAGWCSLVGILQYDEAGEGRYLIKLRDERDCQ